MQSRDPGAPESWQFFFGIEIPGPKLSQHRDFDTNILFIFKTKCIANMVSSLNFFLLFYSWCSVCINNTYVCNRKNSQLHQRNTLSSNMLWLLLIFISYPVFFFGKIVRIKLFAWLIGEWEKWTWMPFVVCMKVRIDSAGHRTNKGQ
jgi:hypothetical protein